MTSKDTAGRLDGADFLRAAGCAIVLLHHLAQYIPFGAVPSSFDWLGPFRFIGGQGVVIFFVLSGFLLSGPFWDALDGGRPMPDLKVYFLRRMARIAPGFWLALTITFLIGVLIYGAPLNLGNVLRFAAGLGFVSALTGFTLFPVELNGPLWSISFEVIAYVLMPLAFLPIFWLARRRHARWGLRLAWAGVIPATLGLHWAYVNLVGLGGPMNMAAVRATKFWHVHLGAYWFPEYNPLGFFATFSVGVLASGVLRMLPERRSFVYDWLFLASLATAASLLWHMTEGGFDKRLHLPYALYPEIPLLIGAMLVAGPRTVLAARVIEQAPVRYFAQVSFGVYLWHMLLMVLVTRFVFPEYHRLNKTDDVAVLLMASGIVVAASILVATASWRWVEQPAIAWARRRETRLVGSHRSRPEAERASTLSGAP